MTKMVKTSPNTATQALIKLLQHSQKVLAGSFDHPQQLNVGSSSLKRSRSSMGNFMDMSSFAEAFPQIEDSVAFPAIEWPASADGEGHRDDCCVPEAKTLLQWFGSEPEGIFRSLPVDVIAKRFIWVFVLTRALTNIFLCHGIFLCYQEAVAIPCVY